MVHQLTRRSPQLTPLGGLLAVTAVGFLWFWSNASVRALLVLAVGLVVALVLDALWGYHALGRPQLEVRCPADAMVGEVLPVGVRVAGIDRPTRVSMLSMPGSPAAQAEPGEAGVLDVVPMTSGRFPWAIFELAVRGPLGLVGWTRRAVVRLPNGVFVAPRFVPHDVRLPAGTGASVGSTAGAGGQPDMVRTVRDYAPGDGSRLIHWSATARTGHLMVKELDPIGAGHLVIVLHLDVADIGDASETAAGRAGHVAERALAEGWTVTLVVRESADDPDALRPVLTSNRLPIRIVKRPAAQTRTRVQTVRSPAEVARHLAGADFGPPELPRGRSGAVRLVRSSGDDRWQ
jgi:uncharacterized protein (DUF58 family)